MCRSHCIARFQRYNDILQFLDHRHCSVCSGSVSTIYKACFSHLMQQLNQLSAELNVLSDHKISFYIILISRNEANCLSLFILALGLYPIDQQKS